MRGCRAWRTVMGWVVAVLAGVAMAEDGAVETRETVLDRKVHLTKELVREIPDVPPLCDGMDAVKQRIDVGGCSLYCEVEGEGTPMVLLNGGPGGTHHYFHPDFSRAKKFARVIYYDQRGCGQSDREPGDGYSIDQAVDDLDALRRALKIDRWVVLGHSYGGVLAQCYAVEYPERVAGLILVGAAPGMEVRLGASRQHECLSKEERKRIREIYSNKELSLAQKVYNAHLNGDWKRQGYYRPSRDELARMALYEWVHDPTFRGAICRDMHGLDLRGAFAGCPIPTLILEGRCDLTWNTDKPEKLKGNHPSAKMIFFERSAHSPFRDEPEAFFAAVKGFIGGLPPVAEADVARWKADLAAWRERRESSPKHVLRSAGWGRASNLSVAKQYKAEWLGDLTDTGLLLKLGFALYDAKRYEEALAVFRAMGDAAGKNAFLSAVALVWQGHMLDLLGRRGEAVAVYEKAAGLGVNGSISHDQFGLRYAPSPYAAKRMAEPFTRVENRQAK